MSIRISSYNCESVTANVNLVDSLLSISDILLLQETFLTNDNHYILNQFGPDFDYAYVSALRKANTYVGRPSGGLAVIWRKIDNVKVFPQYYSDRIMGLKLCLDSEIILLINVYMPCDYGDTQSLVDYKSNIAELETIVNEASFSKLIIVGDFNSDPYRGRFYSELLKLINELSLCVRDVESLPTDSYSYISRNNVCSTSWLDHLVTSANCVPQNINILYGFAVDDHIPLCFTLELEKAIEYVQPEIDQDEYHNYINWNMVTNDDIREYSVLLDYLVENYTNSIFFCNREYCCDVGHLCHIDELFNYVKDAVLFASINCFPYTKYSNSGAYEVVPGWNDYCREAHEEARKAYLIWHRNGKIRSGHCFDNMKTARSRFRRSLRYCRENQLRIRREKFLSAFRERNKYKFWTQVKKLNKISHNNSVIDGNANVNDIVAVFDGKFREILNKPPLIESRQQLIAPMPNIELFKVFFRSSALDNSISRLNDGQGWDNVHSKHLKYSGRIFREFLSRIFSIMLLHSFIPKELLRGHIKPVLKSGATCRTSSDSYRPIMNSSVFLKVFEYCLLPVLKRELEISNLQFGFTSGSDCQSAVTFAKETIFSYTDRHSSVHCAAIDLSKAFDRIDVNILVNKLSVTGIPLSIVRIIEYMLRNSFVNVCYGKQVGKEWIVTSGVRQGGILSPILFNFYINDCLEKVSEMSQGCRLCYQPSNIIGYADDLLLLAPSARGLQKLLDVTTNCIRELSLQINVNKSQYIVFRNKPLKDVNSEVSVDGVLLKRVDSIKYLGVYLSNNLNLGKDIDRVTDCFLRQFNALFYKFRFVSADALSFLFRTYTSSFYGIGGWFDHTLRPGHLNGLSIAYHKAVKKVASMNVWESNHVACERVGVDTFPHLLAKRLLAHYVSFQTSKCTMMKILKYHFLFNSRVKANIDRLFSERYGVTKMSNSDTDALFSRINYVQRNEPRTCYVLGRL